MGPRGSDKGRPASGSTGWACHPRDRRSGSDSPRPCVDTVRHRLSFASSSRHVAAQTPYKSRRNQGEHYDPEALVPSETGSFQACENPCSAKTMDGRLHLRRPHPRPAQRLGFRASLSPPTAACPTALAPDKNQRVQRCYAPSARARSRASWKSRIPSSRPPTVTNSLAPLASVD